MARSLSMPDAQESRVRHYAGLGGVDFSSNPSMVALNRSPDAKNIYKNYHDTMGQAIETRPGISCLGKVASKIYGLHILGTKCLIHYGTTLALWETFPNTIVDENDLTVLSSQLPMSETDSISFVFGSKLYIMDGAHYYVYNGTALADVCDSANCFIPTTRIGADPDGGNAMTYQGVNLLQAKRKNSFVGNGTSTTYRLDTASIDNNYTPLVWVNGTQLTTGITYNASAGTVGISPAPSVPSTPGQDNVIIQFSKTAGTESRIKNCKVARVFDNRVFVSGNSNYAGNLFHSELNDPTYFADTSYYTDGDDGADIAALIQGQGVLIAVKEDRGTGSKVYLHTPSLVYTDATDANSEVKAYPRMETEIMLGCSAGGVNFMDDIVYISPMGLEAIRLSNDSSLEHRSTLIDTKFMTEENFQNCKMEIWNNYLMILINGKIYLADSRQKYAGADCMQYEWYFWDNIGVWSSNTSPIFNQVNLMKEYDGNLYLGCNNGYICVFSGYKDYYDGASANIIKAATGLTSVTHEVTPDGQPQKLRSLSVTGNTATAEGNVIINGINMVDEQISETTRANGAVTVNGSSLFKTVTSITLPAGEVTDTISVGVTSDVWIDSYWTTPMDNFGAMTLYKTTRRTGGIAQIKRIPNSVIKIDVQTDKESWVNILESKTSGFSYENFSYEEFIYGTGIRGEILYKIKKRKIKELSLKFYSDNIGKPFGLYDAALEIAIQNYIKK